MVRGLLPTIRREAQQHRAARFSAKPREQNRRFMNPEGDSRKTAQNMPQGDSLMPEANLLQPKPKTKTPARYFKLAGALARTATARNSRTTAELSNRFGRSSEAVGRPSAGQP